MKKLILLGLTMLIISCNNESNLDSELDLTSLSKSKLKTLIENSKNVRNKMEKRMNDILLSQVERKIDTPPGDNGEICPAVSIRNKATLTHSNSIVNSINIFNDDSRAFRDSTLLTGETGVIYKDAYYYLGSYLSNDEISFSDVEKFVSVMPTVRNIYNRMKDNSYNGVVISLQEKQEVLEFINYIAPKIQDDNEQINIQLINAIKEDLNTLTNRNSNQISEFIAQ